jgi:hypothetical protein
MVNPMNRRDPWAWAGIAVVGLTAIVWSFAALSDLAHMVGVTTVIDTWWGWQLRIAWGLPITVDVLAVVATRVWLRGTAPADAIAYACRAAWAAIGASIGGNGYHGLLVGNFQFDALIVSAVPAVVIGVIVHLAVLVGRPPKKEPPDEESTPDRSSFVWAVDSATGSRLVKLYPDGSEEPGDPFSPDPAVADTPAQAPFVWAVDETAQLDYAGFQRLADEVARARATAGEPGDENPPLPDRRGLVDTDSLVALCDDLRAIGGRYGRQLTQDEIKTMYGIGSTKAGKARRQLGWWPRAVDQADEAKVVAR